MCTRFFLSVALSKVKVILHVLASGQGLPCPLSCFSSSFGADLALRLRLSVVLQEGERVLEEILRAGAVHRDQVFLIVVLLNDWPDALVRRRVRRLRLGEPDADLPGVVVDINLHTGSPFLKKHSRPGSGLNAGALLGDLSITNRTPKRIERRLSGN